jgi:hypothetical protein
MFAVITLKTSKFAAVQTSSRTLVRGHAAEAACAKSASRSAARPFLTRLLHALAVGAA